MQRKPVSKKITYRKNFLRVKAKKKKIKKGEKMKHSRQN